CPRLAGANVTKLRACPCGARDSGPATRSRIAATAAVTWSKSPAKTSWSRSCAAASVESAPRTCPPADRASEGCRRAKAVRTLPRQEVSSMRRALSIAAAAAGAVLIARRWMPRASLRGRVVLITGGSRGLGLVLARRLARKGARIAICARDENELERAREDLAKHGADAFTVTCDVRLQSTAERMVEMVVAHYGRLDVLVNNAGIIEVGPQTTMTLADYHSVMGVNFWGAVHVTLAALPHLRRSSVARIVNITSIGAYVPIPHLLPYTSAKYAMAGFSEGLATEVADEGVRVTTVVPGLMRTGSFVNALFKGERASEVSWFSLG